MPVPRSQLRMTPDELDEFLNRERTARVATVSPNGEPHVAPLWFVWLDGKIYMNSLNRSRRMRHVERGSRVAVCVDAGEEYGELHGAVLYGTFRPVDDPEESARVRALFGQKYWSGMEIPEVRSHTWLVMDPDKVVSWDFKKIPQGRDRRLEATSQDTG